MDVHSIKLDKSKFNVISVPPVVYRSETGNGARCLCDDCREGREALPHDDDQESAPDKG